MSDNFDLFGDPVPERWGRAGRPEHIPTQQNCNKIKMLVALGWSNERIARALFVDRKTLRKHYSPQLRFRDEQRDRLNASLAMRLWQQVEAGNVGAIKEFRSFLEQNDLMLYGQTQPPRPKEPKLGKKEQAARLSGDPIENTAYALFVPPRAPLYGRPVTFTPPARGEYEARRRHDA